MKNSTKVFVTIVGLLTALMQIPSVQMAVAGLISAHPAVASIIAGVSSILALVHQPQAGV